MFGEVSGDWISARRNCFRAGGALPDSVLYDVDGTRTGRGCAMTPIYLSNRVPWFGEHTGYQQLPRYMQTLVPETMIIGSKNCLTEKMLGKAYSLYRGWNDRNQPDAAAEFRFLRANSVPAPAKHILHFEEHYLFFDRWERAPREFIATLHIPRDQITPGELDGIKRLSSAIVLYRRDVE